MDRLTLTFADRPPVALDPDRPLLTIGRDPGNDVVLDNSSLSRFHARLTLAGGAAILEDLHSRNGTRVNGEKILEPRCVGPGDDLTFGWVPVHLEGSQEPAPSPEDTTSFLMGVDELRALGPSPEAGASSRLKEAMDIVYALSLDVLSDMSPEAMLEDLLDRLFVFLKPGRGAVLLRDAEGAMAQVVARSSGHGRDFQVQLSRTMLRAAVERREALLINNPMLDSSLAAAQSLMSSGATTIMTVPLEHGGEVVGIIYFDAGILRGAFTEEDLRLVAVVGHMAAAKIRTTRLMEEVLVKKTMEREFEIARTIQERILPDRCPDLEGFQLFGVNTPCRDVSGDIYGFWPGPDGTTWLAIADVSGKGIGPGLLMATFQALMQAWCEGIADPAALAKKVSVALSRRTTVNRFITAFLAILDPARRTIAYTSAGHNPVPVVRADGTVEALTSQGFPLAMFPGTEYGQGRLQLEPGDLLFLYTDGITEAAGPDELEFGLDRVCDTLRALSGQSLPEVNKGLAAALHAFTRGALATDDRTVVMVRRAAPVA